MIKEEIKFIQSDLMEGMPSISALLKGIENGTNNRKILKIYFDRTKAKKKQRELHFLQIKSKELSFPIEWTDPETIDAMSIGKTHGGIIADCTERTLPPLCADTVKDRGIYFILDGVEDPYNFGYAIRSLYASGVDGIILDERNWMGAAGVVARSSAGASEMMNLYVCKPTDAIRLLKEKGYSVVCAGIRDSESLFDADLQKPLLVILGGEKRGISRSILDQADRIIRIDYGTAFGGSLSTSAAAAVFAFEILRKNR